MNDDNQLRHIATEFINSLEKFIKISSSRLDDLEKQMEHVKGLYEADFSICKEIIFTLNENKKQMEKWEDILIYLYDKRHGSCVDHKCPLCEGLKFEKAIQRSVEQKSSEG